MSDGMSLFDFFEEVNPPVPSRDDDVFRVMVTGHRPPRLGGYRPNPTQDWVRANLRSFLRGLQGRHGERLQATSGMALGTDQWFVEEAHKLGVRVLACLPFEGQENKWPGFSQDHYNSLLNHPLTETYFVSHGDYSGSKLIGRNQFMVDISHASAVVWDESYEDGGGTLDAISRIIQADLPAMLFNPFREYVGPLPPF